MKIATWNINGVRARVDTLLTWLAETKPDVVCLQEIKSVDEGFPRDAIEAAGYDVAVHGQKGFNGVALLSRSGSAAYICRTAIRLVPTNSSISCAGWADWNCTRAIWSRANNCWCLQAISM